jgi:hypothetical protein
MSQSGGGFSLVGAISIKCVSHENADAQNAKKCHYSLNHRESPF